MTYFLSSGAVLRRLEVPSVYHIKNDDLYELDEDSFRFLKRCASVRGCRSEGGEFTDYCLAEGLLTEEAVQAKRPQVLRSPEPSLRYLELQITNRCNLRCRHCYIGDRTSSELPPEQIRSVLRQFERMQGLRVMITGGEPLMHSMFDSVNEMLPDFFMRKVLFTNGSLLSTGLLKRLHVDEIQVSIDGLEESHDSLRGKGTFRKAVRAVRLAAESGFEVSVATVVHANNTGDFNEMEEFLEGLGIKDWTVDIACPAGRLKDNADLILTPEIGGRYLQYGHGGGLHSGASGYACGLHLMAVLADGRISKCSFYADSPVGSVREGLRRCWQRIKPLRLSDLACDCDIIDICRGGCRHRAMQLGDPLGRDLYKCFHYDRISEGMQTRHECRFPLRKGVSL